MLNILSDDFTAFPFKDELLKSVKAHKKSILLVPEQLALSAEKQVAECFPPDTPLYFEVSNFSRLADRVFRTEGGISYRYADHAAEIVLMWKTLDALSPFLFSRRAASADRVKEHLSAHTELSASGVRAEDLRRAARGAGETAFGRKLSDLAMTLELYEGERREIYGSLSDDLEKLLAILKEKPLFADTEIYVFGFTSFTADELAILGELMRVGSVFVALPLPEGCATLAHEEVLATHKALRSLAARIGTEVKALPPLSKSRTPMLKHAVKELFRADGAGAVYTGEYDGSLSFITAKDPYEGCAHIAAEIAERVRLGARFRDFTVVTRAPEKYAGILDEALAAQGIPYFFSDHTDLTELSLTKMILSAYACLERGFRRSDLIAYLKCGFAGITADDCDIFELYAEAWRIKGSRFADGQPFDMHPRGYVDRFTDADSAKLARVNAVREQILPPLLALRDATLGERTAREHATALYEFLLALDTERRLHTRAKEARLAGREGEADRLSRLTAVLYDLLDRIQEIMGDLPLTRVRFSELLSLVFSSVSLGTLPTSGDAVTVANADTYRPSTETRVFLLGAVEGEFPAAVHLGGVFPEEERRALEEMGIAVGKPPEVRASREQFSFLRPIASAEVCATVVSFEANALLEAQRPSSPLRRLWALFPDATRKTGTPKAFTPRASLDGYFERQGTAEGVALASLLAESPALSRLQDVSATPIHDPQASVGEKTTSRLFPDDMHASQSKLEDYMNCPFAYYLKRGVLLAEDQPAVLRPVDVGNMIHAILESFFALLAREGTDIHSVAPARIPVLVEEACADYLSRVCPPSMHASPRLSHLFARVRRAAILVTEDIYDEFLHSRFTPLFCELPLEGKDAPGALIFRDADGKSVSIGGRIDRVDTYRAQNGELFVRVVDYKTGSRVFSRDELKKGRNLQMFVYLCAIWKSQNEAFLSRLDLKEGESPLPAGIVYNTVDPKTVSLSSPVDEEALVRKIRKENLARRGFFLAEEEVIRAMDDDLSHFDLPQKGGALNLDKKSLFGSLVEFGEMLDDTEDAVLAVARKMRSGCADATPDEKVNPCAYCPYVPVCRKSDIKKNTF